jgi:pimeloyl-ACP methyl ester carboxylesterase
MFSRLIDLFLVHKYFGISTSAPPTPNQQLVETEDGNKIDIFFHKSDDESAPCPTIVVFHGGDTNISNELKSSGELIIQAIRADVVLFDPRGYGRSKGIPTQSGIMIDIDAVMDFIHKNSSEPYNVIFFGRSLGCAFALKSYEKYKDRVTFMVLENPFLSIASYAPSSMKSVTSNLWNNEDEIQNVRCPVVIIQSTNDKVTPPHHSVKLFNNIQHRRKELWKYDNNHLETGSYLTFYHRLIATVRKYLL